MAKHCSTIIKLFDMSGKIKSKQELSLEALIAKLPHDPSHVSVTKKPSVREAIISLKDRLGSKVFTKRQLKEIVEVAFPELDPVAMPNLDASMTRAKEYLECVKTGEQNIYRFKQKQI